MTKADQPKPPPLPLLLVHGKPTSPDLPQASWFRIEDRLAVHAAAHALKFAVIDIGAEPERTVLEGVHEGVLKGNGRMIVGSVSVEAYQRIEEHARMRNSEPNPLADKDGAAGKALPEQIMNPLATGTALAGDKAAKEVKDEAVASKSEPAAASKASAITADLWDALRVGSHVVAKDWDQRGEAIGWWLGTITGFDKQDFVIVWRDEPNTPPLRVARKHVAILHPSFDVKTEWDRKPTRRK